MGDIKKVKLIGRQANSIISVSDTNIRIVRDDAEGVISPLGVVVILPKLEIELGREIYELSKCISLTRIPVYLQRVGISFRRKKYIVWRTATGKVPEVMICQLDVRDGVIECVVFNEALVYDTEFKKYQKLSIMHQLTIDKRDHLLALEKAAILVEELTGIDTKHFKIRSNTHSIVVSIGDEYYNYEYAFIKDSREYYSLLAVKRKALK